MFRNKCEFTFGHELVTSSTDTVPPGDPIATTGGEGEEGEGVEPQYIPSLGFRVSSFKDGVLVESPFECPNVPEEMKLVVQKFTDLIRSTPDLPVYDQHKHAGVWRLLTCRYSRRTNQMVVMLCVCLRGISVEAWSTAETAITSMLSSLCWQEGQPFVHGFCVQV